MRQIVSSPARWLLALLALLLAVSTQIEAAPVTRGETVIAAGPSATPTKTPIPTKTPTMTPTASTTPTKTATPQTRQLYLPLLFRLRPPSCVAAEVEPNDSSGQARAALPICEGALIAGTLPSGDPDDFYRIVVATGGTVQIDLTALPAGTDYDLFLYDSAFALLDQSRNFDQQPEQIVATLGAGDYFIRVFPFAGRSDERYELRWVGP